MPTLRFRRFDEIPPDDQDHSHINSLAVLAEGLSLRADVPTPPTGPGTELVAPVDGTAHGTAEPLLQEIRQWAKSTLGVDQVPVLWRVLARHPRFLAATWAKNCLVLAFNTIAHGMMLEAPFTDMRAVDFGPGGRFVDAPGPGSRAPAG